jgi:hypothetical protein
MPAPTWPYELWWCDACGEPCVTSATHDPEEHPGGCGGEVTTYVVGPIAPVKGTNGERWEYRPDAYNARQ